LWKLQALVDPRPKDVFYRHIHSDAAMDRKLLDILVCPASRQPLSLLDKAGLSALNRGIAAGTVRRNDDAPQSEPLQEALVTQDRRTVYRIDDGIPVLLVEEGIATGQVADFPG
jgi:uncharacterized protein YbaR (Trm112 family)